MKLRSALIGALAGLLSATPASAALVGWGGNSLGQIGAGYKSEKVTEGTTLLNPAKVSAYSAGHGFTLALLKNGTLVGFGSNAYGQLGNGKYSLSERREEPVVVPLKNVTKIAAGGQHAAAIDATGQLWTWGGDLYGTLGTGQTGEGSEAKTHPQTTPEKVPGFTDAVNVWSGGDVVYVERTNGDVYGFGEGQGICDGQKQFDVPRPVLIPGVSHLKEAATDGEGTLGSHAIFLTNDGRVFVCGSAQYGQEGDGSQGLLPAQSPKQVALPPVVEVAAGENHNLARTANGDVYAWGLTSFGQAGVAQVVSCGRGKIAPCVTKPQKIVGNAVQIAARRGSSYALLATGLAKGWGSNEVGQLGNGHTAKVVTKPVTATVQGITQIVGGGSYELAVVPGEGPPDPFTWTSTNTSVSLNWNGTSTGWRIRWRPQKKGKLSPYINLPASQHSYVLSGLAPNSAYTISLIAVDKPKQNLSVLAFTKPATP